MRGEKQRYLPLFWACFHEGFFAGVAKTLDFFLEFEQEPERKQPELLPEPKTEKVVLYLAAKQPEEYLGRNIDVRV